MTFHLHHLNTLSTSTKAACLLSACAFALYAWTAAPTLAWGGGDSAKLAIWVHRGEVGASAESHPLYVLLGQAAAALPLGGDLAYRLNLFSALCAAAAVGAMFSVCLQITDSVAAASCASIALAVSHTFWLHAVITEVYALHLLLLLASLAWLLRWDRTGKTSDLSLAAFCLGAGVANHILTACAIPAIVWFAWRRWNPSQGRPRGEEGQPGHPGAASPAGLGRAGGTLAAAGIWGCLGASPLVYALARSQEGIWLSLGPALGQGGSGHFALNATRLPLYLAYLFFQFPFAGFALGAAGHRTLFRKNRPVGGLILGMGVPYLLFPIVWDFRDHYQFALSFYACFAVGIAPGMSEVWGRGRGPAARALGMGLLAALPVLSYAIAPAVCRGLGVDLVRARTLPYRDNDRYFLWPPKNGDDGPRRFGMETLRNLAPDGLIVGDYTPSMVLTYYQDVDGLRPDVEIRFTADVPGQLRLIGQQIDRRPVYVAALEGRPGLPSNLYLRRDALSGQYDVIPESSVYRIVRKENPPPGP